ncbi:type I-F CRISPR-associated protein Csy2 [Serratia marcescens]|uniref:type I-F CRISPR-associated protein Csy2 n=1 Tax=Serratia marcescens TaxID=615 RepID=UPI000A384568|nr:type I-F CRISPR-associated protein Csy2 [Serratia marcescens]MBH2983195.1 type I-F CRISPR-associated protein Csy2 [Serratia marcescens]OUI70111.1 CRISPR type I-f/ypest-associated protein csy2 [Serratia marcescens]
MSHVIVLRHLQVENANAVAGLTYGFPAISHFLGYVHALSRKLQASHGLTLGGCGVICHRRQIHAHSSGRDYQFALTRNPLTKEAKTAAFNEEGRMHMTVSLVIECAGEIANSDIGLDQLQEHLYRLCQTQKLAGGSITRLRGVSVRGYPQQPEDVRRLVCQLLPGFALLDRSELLQQHFTALKQHRPQAEMLDAWLDFAALKMQAMPTHQEKTPEVGDKAEWEYVGKPQPGYLVPLMTGYQRISPLYPAGEVLNARDASTPFCFAEAVYGVGEWCGLHRIHDLSALFWRYQTTDNGYYCRTPSVVIPQDDESADSIYLDDF